MITIQSFMVVNFDTKGLAIHEMLDKEEALVFCKFLETEALRHIDDINNIMKTIKYLEDKFDFKANLSVNISDNKMRC